MKKIKIKYQKSSDFRNVPVSGATGGITPQGEINCNLFFESNRIVDESLLSIDEEQGKILGEEPTQTETIIERTLVVGLILRPAMAKIIGEWLIKQTEQYELESERLKRKGNN